MTSLQSFQTKPFIAALKDFFAELHVPHGTLADEPATPQDILGEVYKPDNDAHLLMDDVYVVGIVNDDIFQGRRTVDNVAELKQQRDDYEGLLLLGITLKRRENGLLPSRSQLAEITRACNRAFKGMPVTVVFLYGGDGDTTLLSFANTERTRYKQEWREGEKVGRVTILRDIRTHETHQGHIRILRQLAEVRVSNFNQLYNAWKEVFDLSTLNKQFYRELANWFFWAKLHTRFGENDTDTERSEALIRLITRLVFCWFLREKGLIPRDVFKPGILESLVNTGDAHNDQSRYYKAVLQNLFFGTLNQDMTERRFRAEGEYQGKNKDRNVNHVYRYKRLIADEEQFLNLFKDVPFLNGGLFECLDDKDNSVFIDRFTDREDNPLHVPDHIFFGDTATVDLNAAYGDRQHSREDVRGLFRIFERYVFTVAENTPLEEEVALDPELLGRIFENLLAAYNPETGETARKATGSFYTPREVVSYMVAESLTAHVAERLLQKSRAVVALGSPQPAMFGNDFRRGQMLIETPLEEPLWSGTREALEENLRSLFDFSDAQPFTEEAHKTAILEALSNVRILDPACGSGAFPMGILQTIVHALRKLDPENTRWKNQQRERLIGDKIREIEQNRAIAASLSIEEVRKQAVSALDAEFERLTADFDRQNHDYARKLYLIQHCIYGVDIQPIAVQIAKLRFFISLVIEQDDDNTKPNRGITPLPNLEVKFVPANALIGLPGKGQQTLRPPSIDDLEMRLSTLRSEYFTATNRKRKRDIENEDIKLSKQLADELTRLNGFDAATARTVASWNPYTPTQAAPFFDAEWMFGITDGFDIVIGNPPYIQLQANGGELGNRYANSGYVTFERTGDIYQLFYERGIQLLQPNGLLAFITSNKWMRAKYGEITRTYFRNHLDIRLLLDFGMKMVFETATVLTNILIGQRCLSSSMLPICRIGSDFKLPMDLGEYVRNHTLSIAIPEAAWVAYSQQEYNVVQKIEQQGVPINQWNITINYGIKTGYNKAFIINQATRDLLCEEDPKSAEIIRPILRGEDVKAFVPEFNNLYLINSHNGVRQQDVPRINVERDYPVVFRWLQQHETKLVARSDQGDHWTNLRSCAYIMEFTNPKIIYPNMTAFLPFVYDETGIMTNQKCFIITGEHLKYLTAVLNSTLWKFAFKNRFPELLGETFELSKVFFDKVPIKKPEGNFESILSEKVEEIIALKQQNHDATALIQEIDVLVYKLYALTYEEVLVIEPELPLSAEEYAGVEV